MDKAEERKGKGRRYNKYQSTITELWIRRTHSTEARKQVKEGSIGADEQVDLSSRYGDAI